MKIHISYCRLSYIWTRTIALSLIMATCTFNFLHAQLYTDASVNLPDNGAKGQSMDVRAADLDNDGDLDIILANEFQANTILWNDGQGVFTKATSEQLPQEVHDSEDIVVWDFNGDGFLDLLFCSEDDITLGWTNVHEYYLGNENGNFTMAPYSFPDSEANAVLALDVNSDGWMDVIFGNKGFNRIYINQADGTFAVEASRLPEISRTTQDLAAADIDGDGDQDLMEGNEDGNVLLLNDGTGKFSDITSTHLPSGVNMETRKVTFGDVDDDNDQDIFLSNVQFIQGKNIQNRLYLNDGAGKFTDETDARLPVDADHTIDAVFEDVDLDGDPDIIVANVFGAPVKIYRNNGSGTFEVATSELLGNNYVRDALGVITADLNGDGQKDIYICDRFMQQANRKDLLLFREPVTSVSSAQQTPLQIHIHPNPIAGNFFVNTSIPGIKSLLLENLQGQIIDTISLEWQDEETYMGSVDDLNLAAGMYIMHFPKQKKKVMVMIKH